MRRAFPPRGVLVGSDFGEVTKFGKSLLCKIRTSLLYRWLVMKNQPNISVKLSLWAVEKDKTPPPPGCSRECVLGPPFRGAIVFPKEHSFPFAVAESLASLIDL